MAKYGFGSGLMFGTRTDVTNSTPRLAAKETLTVGTGGAGLGSIPLNANVILLQHESGAIGTGAITPTKATSSVMWGGGGAASGAAASTPFWLHSGAGGAVGVAGTALAGGGGGRTTTSGAGGNGQGRIAVF